MVTSKKKLKAMRCGHTCLVSFHPQALATMFLKEHLLHDVDE